MNASKTAFLMTCQNLFATSHKVYFWTFTFREAMDFDRYGVSWSKFYREVSDLYGGYIAGVRVVEAHEEHGLHYHMLINTRISVAFIRRLAERHGIFWIDVRECDAGAPFYLAKYLRPANDCLGKHRIHRWQAFGVVERVKVKDLVYDSPYIRCRNKVLPGRRVPIGWEQLLRKVFELHGPGGLQRCWDKLASGRLSSAAACLSPHVEITAAGGLRRRRVFTLGRHHVTVNEKLSIPFQSVTTRTEDRIQGVRLSRIPF